MTEADKALAEFEEAINEFLWLGAKHPDERAGIIGRYVGARREIMRLLGILTPEAERGMLDLMIGMSR